MLLSFVFIQFLNFKLFPVIFFVLDPKKKLNSKTGENEINLKEKQQATFTLLYKPLIYLNPSLFVKEKMAADKLILMFSMLCLIMTTSVVSGKKVQLAFLYNIPGNSENEKTDPIPPAIKTALDVLREQNVYLKDHDIEIFNYYMGVSIKRLLTCFWFVKYVVIIVIYNFQLLYGCKY